MTAIVGAHMQRTASLVTAVVLVGISATLNASTCNGPYDQENWARSMATAAAFVFVGRVTAVVSPSADVTRQVAVLEVQSVLKGSPDFNRVSNPPVGAAFRLVAGDVRVFFVDSRHTILSCSDYAGRTTEQIVREVRSALYGSTT